MADKWVDGGGSGPDGRGSGGGSSSGGGGSGSLGSGVGSGGGGSGGGGSGSGGNLYEDLEPKLRETFQGEWDDLDGTKPRRFFTDRFGESSYEELFKKFLADSHDAEWSKLVQSEHGNFTKILTHARAIGYMDAMWRELHQLYLVNEINALDEERNAVGNWLYQDPEILEFLKPKD